MDCVSVERGDKMEYIVGAVYTTLACPLVEGSVSKWYVYLKGTIKWDY